MNCQWNPSIYEVWRPELAEDIEKLMVRRLCWDGKVLGICRGTKATAIPGPVTAAGYGEES